MDTLLDRKDISFDTYYRMSGFRTDIYEDARQKFWAHYWKTGTVPIKFPTEEDIETALQFSFVDETMESIMHGFRWLFGDLFE